MTFQLTDALRYSEEAHEHIWSQIHGTKFPGDDRSFLALTYVSVALEHQTSIRKLIEMDLRGSAAALLPWPQLMRCTRSDRKAGNLSPAFATW
jgi:hypothetical protein